MAGNNLFTEIGKMLVDVAGGDGEDLDEAMGSMGDSPAVTSAVTAGAALGMTLAEQRRQLRAADTGADVDKPAVHTREVVGMDGEPVGMRILVSDPDAELYAGDGEVLIASGGYSITQPLGFDPGDIDEIQGSEGMSEWMVTVPVDDRDDDDDVDDDPDVIDVA